MNQTAGDNSIPRVIKQHGTHFVGFSCEMP